MNTITIEILNPKAKKLLKNLVDLDLINIRENKENGFSKLLKKLRSNDTNNLSLDDITNEVEQERSNMHGKKD